MNEAAHRPAGAPASLASVYRFADLTLHRGQRRLERDGKPIELGKLTYSLLVALVEAAPNVLTHDELVRAVWAGRSTSPETVTQRVKLLRDALGDNAQQPRYVGLIRSEGYRLIPRVERFDVPSATVPAGRVSGGTVVAGESMALTRSASATRRRIALAGLSAALLALVVAAAYVVRARLAGSSPGYEYTQLTSSGRAAAPAISPDGEWVVYVQGEDNGTSLRVRQVGTTNEVQVVAPDPESHAMTPSVSPDGRYIDYIKFVFGKGPELWRVPFLGGTPRQLRTAVSSSIGWSPDQKRGAFVAYDQGTNTSLVEVDDRFEERVLGTRTVPDFFVSLNVVGAPPARPAYSPDGRFIATAVIRDILAPRIAVIDRETGAETLYDPQGSFVPHGVGWLGPSTLVVSQPAALGQRIQLFKVSYPDGTIEPLTRELASYIGVSLDDSRSRLVTTQRDVRTSVWLADASGATATQLVPPTPFGTPNVFLSWAGDRLLYDSTFGGYAAVAAIGLAGGTPVEVVRDAFHVAAAPDGSAVVFGSAARGREGLWKVDAAGQRPVQLVSGFAVEPVVTVDGAVLYISNRSGVQSPWRVPLDGGEAIEIIPEHANSIDVSPDGRWIAFLTWRGVDSIVVCELPRCSNRLDLPYSPSIAGALRWTPDGTELTYIDAPSQNIWAMPLDGGPPHALTTFAPDSTRIMRFAWSRDGRLAFVRASVEHNVVLLSGLRP